MVSTRESNQKGFTYIAVLVALAILGLMLAAVGDVWHTVQQREKERDLLFIGNQFRQAIALYYERSTGPVKQYPKTLEDMLADKRFANAPPYLRKIFYDPMMRTQEWGLVKSPEGGVIGVYSLSEGHPVKTWGFAIADAGFEGRGKYSEWEFVYVPVTQNASQMMEINSKH